MRCEFIYTAIVKLHFIYTRSLHTVDKNCKLIHMTQTNVVGKKFQNNSLRDQIETEIQKGQLGDQCGRKFHMNCLEI